jgi:hypothetical protein
MRPRPGPCTECRARHKRCVYHKNAAACQRCRAEEITSCNSPQISSNLQTGVRPITTAPRQAPSPPRRFIKDQLGQVQAARIVPVPDFLAELWTTSSRILVVGIDAGPQNFAASYQWVESEQVLSADLRHAPTQVLFSTSSKSDAD